MSQVLLVEDESHLAASLRDYLAGEGLEVETVATVSRARDALGPRIGCVVLDWRLPDGSGLDLLREWRAAGRRVPVLVLTARAELVDKVLALELGANDYLTKPFEPRELLARIRVQLRESSGRAPAESQLRRGEIAIDLKARTAWSGKTAVELTKLEFDLLRLFLENPNQVFSRDELLNRVWGYDSYPTTRTVDNHILQLRKLFGSVHFETVRGIGYRFRETPGGRC